MLAWLFVVVAVLVVAALCCCNAPEPPRTSSTLGYRVDARRWPLLEVVLSDERQFRSFDGIRWFRYTPPRFERVRRELTQVEREKMEELDWDDANELITLLRGIFERHGVTFFDVIGQRLLLEADNGSSQKTA